MMKSIIRVLAGAVLFCILGGCTTGKQETPGVDSSPEILNSLKSAGIKTESARLSSLMPVLSLNGQVSATEQGQAIVTAPLTGVIVEPLIRVGQLVSKGEPLAVINSVFGQTALQLLQKLEQDQSNLVTSRGALAQARGNLTQAQSALGQARAAESQARDNLTGAKAELSNARKDMKRKQVLEKGGVFSVSDVDEARERYVKALSAEENMAYALKVARQGISLAETNVRMLSLNVPLSSQNVLLAETTLERDKAIYRQSQLCGANLPQNLTPVGLSPGAQVSSVSAAESTFFHIRAPIDGVVTNVTMSAGLAVSPGTALATLVDTRRVYVDANAFETDLQCIHEGDKLEVITAAQLQKRFSGRVTYVGKQVDPATRTVPVRSLIDNPEGLLRPSLFVTVKIQANPRRAAILVPENAVLIQGESRFLFVEVSASKYEKRSVKTGLAYGGKVEILTGVKAGERVVTDGNLILEGV